MQKYDAFLYNNIWLKHKGSVNHVEDFWLQKYIRTGLKIYCPRNSQLLIIAWTGIAPFGLFMGPKIKLFPDPGILKMVQFCGSIN